MSENTVSDSISKNLHITESSWCSGPDFEFKFIIFYNSQHINMTKVDIQS